MEINADFAKPIFIQTSGLEWLASPMAGVDRRMLDRIGDEVARATSIVRYAKSSAFPEHTHSGGEEFIVLEGTFQDEHGDYPVGTYVRNPVGTHHIPRSDAGCTIFVKLWQFDPEDQEQFAIDLNALALVPDPQRPGVSHAPLANRDYETVSFEQWDAGTQVELTGPDGVEALILAGNVSHAGEVYSTHDWVRLPSDYGALMTAGNNGARLWLKRGHLGAITTPTPVA